MRTTIPQAFQIAGAHDVPAHILDVLTNPDQASAEQVAAILQYSRADSTKDAREIAAIWDNAKTDAALYKDVHCVGDEVQARHIMERPQPKIGSAFIKTRISATEIRQLQ